MLRLAHDTSNRNGVLRACSDLNGPISVGTSVKVMTYAESDNQSTCTWYMAPGTWYVINYSQQELGKLRSSQCWVMLWCEQLWTREKRAYRRDKRREERWREEERGRRFRVFWSNTCAHSWTVFLTRVCLLVRPTLVHVTWYTVHSTCSLVHGTSASTHQISMQHLWRVMVSWKTCCQCMACINWTRIVG